MLVSSSCLYIYVKVASIDKELLFYKILALVSFLYAAVTLEISTYVR